MENLSTDLSTNLNPVPDASLSAERTPPVIAVEINTIKYQFMRVHLFSAVEIGRRLKEVKLMLQHGEWLKWLGESVSYSVKTAQNLIRIYEAYGIQPPALPDATTQDQKERPPNLGYTQALVLLGVPDEDRERFIEELDVESMTACELKKAVDERKQAHLERDQALQEKADLQKALDKKAGELTRLAAERDSLEAAAKEAKKARKETQAEKEKLSTQVASLLQNSNVKRVESMGRKLNETYYKNRANRIAYLLEDMRRSFKDLVFEMKEFAEKEPEGHEIYRQKILEFFSKAMLEKMTK